MSSADGATVFDYETGHRLSGGATKALVEVADNGRTASKMRKVVVR